MFNMVYEESKIELNLSSCPHCGDNINIKCKSIFDDKTVIKQFYKYFNWHLGNECFDKNIRVKKKIKVNIKTKSGFVTTYETIDLIV
jgi:hypothetical protein